MSTEARRLQRVETPPTHGGPATTDNNNLRRILAKLEPTKRDPGTKPEEKSGDHQFHLFLGNGEGKENPDRQQNITKPDGGPYRDKLADTTNAASDTNIMMANQVAQRTGEFPSPIEPPPTNVQRQMMNLGRQVKLALKLQQSKSTERQGQLDDLFGPTPQERIKAEVKDQLSKSKAEQDAQQREREKQAITPVRNFTPPNSMDQSTKPTDPDDSKPKPTKKDTYPDDNDVNYGLYSDYQYLRNTTLPEAARTA